MTSLLRHLVPWFLVICSRVDLWCWGLSIISLAIISKQYWGLPAGILWIWAQLHQKPPSPVELHTTPDGVGPKASLGLVLPGAVEGLWGIITHRMGPGWTIGAHVLQIPWIWSMTVRHRLVHRVGNMARVLLHPHLAKASITHQLGVPICDKACYRM